jgi:hypothetical protein
MFLPDDFEPPPQLDAGPFRLVPLDPVHAGADLAAWSADIDHVRRTPGFRGAAWPPPEGMSLEQNRSDLARHRDDFRNRRGFTYTVLDGEDQVIGCVYIYPSAEPPQVAEVRSWVRAADAHLDVPLHEAVATWLSRDWPFRCVLWPGREGVDGAVGGVEEPG